VGVRLCVCMVKCLLSLDVLCCSWVCVGVFMHGCGSLEGCWLLVARHAAAFQREAALAARAAGMQIECVCVCACMLALRLCVFVHVGVLVVRVLFVAC